MEKRSHLRLDAKGICKAYATPVLKNVDLAIPPGQIHGLVGENGAGKSTLAKILVGLAESDLGSLYLDGNRYHPTSAGESLRAGVAICAQELSLVDELSIAENILLHTSVSTWARIKRKNSEEAAANLLKLVGLEHLSPRMLVRRLSLAEKQLVEIAKTLATNAKLLILDEPTSALTVQHAERLHELLKERSRNGVSVIYISHRLADVLTICHRVSVLRDGEVQLTEDCSAVTEKTLIREMAGTEESFDSAPRPTEHDKPLHLTIEGLQTSKLPNPISFHCRRGEILGIAGLAGSGRTELLHAVFGLDKRVAGNVKLHTKNGLIEPQSPRQSIKSGVGLVTEDRAQNGVFKNLPLTFNVTIAGLRHISARIGKLVRKLEIAAVAKLIQALRVRSNSIQQRMHELSGGNQQKIMLARWLHSGSQLLLLDEPTRGVDVNAKHAIHSELVRMRDAGITVIAVSSELEELQNLCDRILVLSNRLIVAEFHRGNWNQQEILAAAFSGYVNEDAPLNAVRS